MPAWYLQSASCTLYGHSRLGSARVLDFNARSPTGSCCAAGKCLLEWDSVDGQKAPVPLLKDMFGSERRKAKARPLKLSHCSNVTNTFPVTAAAQPVARKSEPVALAVPFRTGEL